MTMPNPPPPHHHHHPPPQHHSPPLHHRHPHPPHHPHPPPSHHHLCHHHDRHQKHRHHHRNSDVADSHPQRSLRPPSRRRYYDTPVLLGNFRRRNSAAKVRSWPCGRRRYSSYDAAVSIGNFRRRRSKQRFAQAWRSSTLLRWWGISLQSRRRRYFQPRHRKSIGGRRKDTPV